MHLAKQVMCSHGNFGTRINNIHATRAGAISYSSGQAKATGCVRLPASLLLGWSEIVCQVLLNEYVVY